MERNTKKKEIYFHVGTGKTGTTFLQYRVFPKFKGIFYIQRTKYKKAIKIISRTDQAKYLVSREFDQQMESEVRKFSKLFPDTTPIIVFRKHDSYIASQYRRFVKNGFVGTFTDFFDLENDKGLFRKHHLDYCGQIQLLEKYFNRKPVVLIYEDLMKDPVSFITKLAGRLDVTIEMKNVNLNRKHRSYSQKQLLAMKSLGRYINMRKRDTGNGKMPFLRRIGLEAIRYCYLFISKFFPPSWFASGPLIPSEQLEQISRYYEDDWKQCLVYSHGYREMTVERVV